jgi:multidrug transporter EmrE-like cation transporter
MFLCRQSKICRSSRVIVTLALASLSGWVFFQRAEDALALYSITLLIVGVVILNHLANETGN